jgi:hypothetical protein
MWQDVRDGGAWEEGNCPLHELPDIALETKV